MASDPGYWMYAVDYSCHTVSRVIVMSQRWHDHVSQKLRELDHVPEDCPHKLKHGHPSYFFHHHYKANYPAIFDLGHEDKRWRTIWWGWDGAFIQHWIGEDAVVEVQDGRDNDPRYELNAYSHKQQMTFGEFRSRVMAEGNNLYMVAQNKAQNDGALAPLWDHVPTLPGYLTDEKHKAFLWYGKDTITPLHHDETNNLMVQMNGHKIVRLIPHYHRDKLDVRVGVHTNIHWLTDKMIADRGIEHIDYLLKPGQALFLPIGWWHCCRAIGESTTLVYTNFVWPNYWGRTGDIPP
jgi:hypothetical protein